MALTRKKIREIIENDELSGEEKVAQIIAGHAESVDALKDERDGYRETADRLSGVEAELKSLKAQGDGGWQKKYEDEHAAYEAYKSDVAAKAENHAKEAAYRKALASAGVPANRIDSVIRVTDLSSVKLDGDGNLTDAETIDKNIKTEWADFIGTTTTTGVTTATPPSNTGSVMTKAEIMKIKNTAERQAALAELIKTQKGN